VHRKHHAFTDKEGDPHSPLLLGFWKVQLGNVFYYVREARNPETITRWAKDIRTTSGTGSSSTGAPWAPSSASRSRCCSWARSGAGRLRDPLHPDNHAGARHQRAGHWWGQELRQQQRDQSPILAWLTGGESFLTITTPIPRASSSA
jgi:hypothetical protein